MRLPASADARRGESRSHAVIGRDRCRSKQAPDHPSPPARLRRAFGQVQHRAERELRPPGRRPQRALRLSGDRTRVPQAGKAVQDMRRRRPCTRVNRGECPRSVRTARACRATRPPHHPRSRPGRSGLLLLEQLSQVAGNPLLLLTGVSELRLDFLKQPEIRSFVAGSLL